MGLNEATVSDSDVFFLINNDAVATPGMVATLVRALKNDGTDLVLPTIIAGDGKQQSGYWYQRHFGLLTTTHLPFSFSYPSGCCMLFRRELLAAGKFFDEDFFMYGEDTMLGWRLRQSARKVRHLDDVLVQHSGIGSSRQYGLFYEYHTARAHILLTKKTWCHPLEIPLLLVTKCIGLGLRAMLRSMRSGSAVPLAAFFLAWFPLNIRTP
jgi:GT2 family glycosyltransferase